MAFPNKIKGGVVKLIIKAILDLIYTLFQTIFAEITLPDLPEGVQLIIDEFTNALVSAVGLFSSFFDLKVVAILIPISIIIINFEYVWSLIMFVLRKIPFLGIE